MSAAKHTPGPWTVDDNYDEPEIVGRPTWACTRFGVPGEWGIAKIVDLYFDEPRHAAGEAQANARLIAAAPDLLAAAKYACRFLREADHDIAFVEAAIAKAEGRSDG